MKKTIMFGKQNGGSQPSFFKWDITKKKKCLVTDLECVVCRTKNFVQDMT